MCTYLYIHIHCCVNKKGAAILRHRFVTEPFCDKVLFVRAYLCQAFATKVCNRGWGEGGGGKTGF